MDFSNSRLLILSGYTALDQLIDGLWQAILFRKTSLPTPLRLIRCRRTLESGAPDSRTSIDSIGRFLTLNSSTWVSSSPIRMSPLVAEGDPMVSLIIMCLSIPMFVCHGDAMGLAGRPQYHHFCARVPATFLSRT